MGGALSRTKGHNHERDVARKLREAFPSATVRRSDQGYGAYEPDVVIEGDAMPVLKKLWIECQCSRNPSPVGKLLQAEEDAAKGFATMRLPIAVWRLHRARTTQATMRFATLAALIRAEFLSVPASAIETIVTVDFDLLLLGIGLAHGGREQ